MSGQNGFSKKQLADQNTKVADLVKEEAKLTAAIERGEKTLAENRDRLKETQRVRTAENAKLEQMIQRGIKIASKGDTSQRAALIAALLMGDGATTGPSDAGQDRGATSPKSPDPAPSRSDGGDPAGDRSDGTGDADRGPTEGDPSAGGTASDEDSEVA